MGALICTAVNLIRESIEAGETRRDRARRAAKVVVTFLATFLFLNRTLLFKPSIWKENPIGAIVWVLLSAMLSLWMSMWASQCEAARADPAEGIGRVAPSPDAERMPAARRAALEGSPPLPYHEADSCREDECPESGRGGNVGATSDHPAQSCAVCLCIMTGSSVVRRTPCGHIYCAECFEAFIETCMTFETLICPLCRSPLAAATDSPNLTSTPEFPLAYGGSGDTEATQVAQPTRSLRPREHHPNPSSALEAILNIGLRNYRLHQSRAMRSRVSAPQSTQGDEEEGGL